MQAAGNGFRDVAPVRADDDRAEQRLAEVELIVVRARQSRDHEVGAGGVSIAVQLPSQVKHRAATRVRCAGWGCRWAAVEDVAGVISGAADGVWCDERRVCTHRCPFRSAATAGLGRGRCECERGGAAVIASALHALVMVFMSLPLCLRPMFAG